MDALMRAFPHWRPGRAACAGDHMVQIVTDDRFADLPAQYGHVRGRIALAEMFFCPGKPAIDGFAGDQHEGGVAPG